MVALADKVIPLLRLLTGTVCACVQPTASVIVTVYNPAQRLLIVAVVCPPGAQEYVYGPVPPVGVKVMLPAQTPQLVFVINWFGTIADGEVIAKLCVKTQPAESLICTE